MNMRIVQNYTEEEIKDLLIQFHQYFKNGFEFENFLKPFLEVLGLTEVVVTSKTRDGGVDLLAMKEGLVEINNGDCIRYKVQAKCTNPTKNITPDKIDALRGNLKANEKGLFITTSRVSNNAKEQAYTKDISKPVYVIDGMDLVKICIEKQIGFAYRPVFSKDALNEFLNTRKDIFNETDENITLSNLVDKEITANDVRCHLISLPSYIVDRIKNNNIKHKLKVIINDMDNYIFTYSPARKYLYVQNSSTFFSKYGIIKPDETIFPKKATWSIDEMTQTIYMKI